MNKKMNEDRIEILEMLEGARRASGLTVVIDMLRAFSVECYLYDLGAEAIRPVGAIEEAFEWRKRLPGCLLAGERWGKMCEGFDLGNSPSAAMKIDLKGKTVIHTTSAGTQGIVNAFGASKIITGSLVNASAIARFILAEKPDHVSLVAMGNGGVRRAPEDLLCAEYIKSLLIGKPLEDIEERIASLRYNGGEHFFNPGTQDVFPEEDFYLCTKRDIFDFVIEVCRDDAGFYTKRIE